MKEIGRVILEALVVVVVGIGFAFAANLCSDKGLELRKNYLAAPKPIAGRSGPSGSTVTQPADVNNIPPPANHSNNESVQAVRDGGFTPVEYGEVLRMYQDERSRNGAYLFVDARSQEHYTDGHVPGAVRLDHPQFDEMFPALLAQIQGAEKIVVYCNGGSCDDSLFVAGDLRDKVGIEPARLLVYVGGFTEWAANKQPVEKGQYMSGDISTGGDQ